MKTCTKCQRSLPESSFNKRRNTKSGLRPECRECQKAQGREYRGPITRNFGGGRYLKAMIDGKTVSIHRHIMEQILGRPLLPNEVVHHINGNKKDNRPENLQVLTPAEHNRIEHSGKPQTEEHKTKVRATLFGNQRRKGVPHSPDIKAKISASLKAAYAKGIRGKRNH